jgi:hypothetical protein
MTEAPNSELVSTKRQRIARIIRVRVSVAKLSIEEPDAAESARPDL